MAFPQEPLAVLVELQAGGTWTDITQDVYTRNPITVTRGRADEGARADPAKCVLVINNRSGQYSPRNPNSPYFGLIGRNTPVRVSATEGTTYLLLPGGASDKVTTPDAAALDIAGDIDIRVDVTRPTWTTVADLAAKYLTTGDQRSWAFVANSDGTLVYIWSPDGTLGNRVTVVSTEPLPAPSSGRMALRVTHDVDNGSSGNTVTFYTAPTIAGPWTQLGEPVVSAGTTSIFSSSADVELGEIAGLNNPPTVGRMHAFELRSGIGGTVVADPDFTAQTAGDTSFADDAGRTWTLEGNTELTNQLIRFVGEISSWPPRWDVSERDVWVPVEASGILRRLGQGQAPLASTMRRGLTSPGITSPPVAYWPCEDAEGAGRIASAIGGDDMRIYGAPELASYEDFAASSPLPVMKTGSFSGRVPSYSVTTDTQVRLLAAIPSGGITNGQVILRIHTSGTAKRWDLFYESGGLLGLAAYDDDGTQLFTTGGVAFDVDGTQQRISVELQQDGTAVDWNIVTLVPGETTGSTFSGTLNSRTVGKVDRVTVAPDRGLGDAAIGHISVQNEITSLFDLAQELAAWTGEPAGERIERLCQEQDITFFADGYMGDSAAMGPQRPATLLELLTEAAEADGGILHETREVLGLAYRPRSALYNEHALGLDYDAGHISPPLDPVEDDQEIANDVTVQREGGSSARVMVESGPLSVQPPPDGIGPYEMSITLNVQDDDDLVQQAGWRSHLGTWDEARYPQITVDLAANPSLIDDIVAIESGARITIDNPPPWLPPERIDQIVRGYSELLGVYDWTIALNCSPAGPYRVAVLDDGQLGRLDSAASTLDAGIDATTTSMDVAVASGSAAWITDADLPAQFPFDLLVGGERMTVTAIGAPSSGVQTFTVTRSVNGVTKTHSAGTQVRLFEPVVIAL